MPEAATCVNVLPGANALRFCAKYTYQGTVRQAPRGIPVQCGKFVGTVAPLVYDVPYQTTSNCPVFPAALHGKMAVVDGVWLNLVRVDQVWPKVREEL